VGLPASFTFTVTAATANGSAVRDVIVNWGDGRTQSLGAVNGTATVSHVYSSDGTYSVSATVTDASGNSTTVSTSVTVIPVPRPTVIVTPTPQTQAVCGTINFSIQITAPSGIGIVSTSIAFGDGTSADLGGATFANVPHSYSNPGTKQVIVTVKDTAQQTTQGTTTVSITGIPAVCTTVAPR
jgi:PKD repeat protein